MEVSADQQGPKIDAVMWTPCAAPSQSMQLFGVTILGVPDCKLPDTKLPLVIMSHGAGGNFLNHRDTAEALANAGFAVIALNHPLDSEFDMKRARDAAAFTERPMDIRRLIDYALQSPVVAGSIDSRRIGFFGFSRGGFTGLLLGGATSDNPDRVPRLPASDPRITAFVLADPLSLFPGKESLQNVRSPIQVWGSQLGDQEDVTAERVMALANNLPMRPEFHMVPNSTHLSFVAPCAPNAGGAAAKICIDPPGFDRMAFHQQFNMQVLAFFQRNLLAP